VQAEKGKGRYKVLFALLAATGLRIGEALGLKLCEHLSGDFSTIKVRQSVWRGSVQTPKTDNAIREIDLPKSLAAFLKTYIGDRASGFLFESESGRPLTQRNVLRDGLGKGWKIKVAPRAKFELATLRLTALRLT
jgi:integrase